MARPREFLVDLHIHSLYSGESLATPKDVIESAVEKGLDAICITEHDSLSASAPFDEIAKGYPLVVLRGVEVSTDAGHMLVYGVRDSDWQDWGKSGNVNAGELILKAKSMGGVVVPAHPYTIVRSGLYDISPVVTPDERVRGLSGFAAIEVCNGKIAAYPAACTVMCEFARSMGLRGTGGSDAHIPEHVGRSYTVFKTPVVSLGTLTSALLSGRFYPRIS